MSSAGSINGIVFALRACRADFARFCETFCESNLLPGVFFMVVDMKLDCSRGKTKKPYLLSDFWR